MANIEKATLEAEFKHGTSLGEHGEILFDCPIEINDKADLDNYGITWEDCRFLHFNGSEKITVYFMKVESRELAEYQWSFLDTQHSRSYSATRCWISGKRKPFIRCPDTISCATCPYKADRKPPVVSLDGLIESGYEPSDSGDTEEKTEAKLTYCEIRALMDAEDVRIGQALEMKELYGFPVKKIAKKMNVSEPRVYQLISRAKVIGNAYVTEVVIA